MTKGPPGPADEALFVAHPVRQGVWSGAAAGLAAVGAMYLIDGVTGTRSLPEVLQQPVLAVMPGPVFGFLIDRLQHLGKVLEEGGLILLMVAVLAAAGAVCQAGWARRRLSSHRCLAGAGVLWLVLTLAILPLAGDGLLGLDEGLATPVVYALVLAIWAAIADLGVEAPGQAMDPGRRQLLTLLPAGIGLVLIGFRLGPRLGAALSPPESSLAGPSPEITPVADFYIVSKNFSDPVVDAAQWRLVLEGEVAHPQSLDYGHLRSLPAVTETVTLECISNVVGGSQISTGIFTGTPLRGLIALAGPRPGARTVEFNSRDGYQESLPLDYVQNHPEVLVAYRLDGSPLPDRHGYPARILVPGRYGMKGPKWLDRIALRSGGGGGYWEGQGWDDTALVRTTSRIDTPQEGALVRLGPVRVAGIAFAGLHGIEAVEVAADGGPWRPAILTPAVSPYTWTLWTITWRPEHQGAHSLTVRARDHQGHLQDPASAPSYPAGSSGYHTVHVDVTT